MILWKKKIVNKTIIATAIPFRNSIIAIMGHQLESFVSRFKSLKKGVGNKFLTPFNSHFMQVPIIAIIEFHGIAVAYFL